MCCCAVRFFVWQDARRAEAQQARELALVAARAEAEGAARAEAERANEDVRARAREQQGALDTHRAVEVAKQPVYWRSRTPWANIGSHHGVP